MSSIARSMLTPSAGWASMTTDRRLPNDFSNDEIPNTIDPNNAIFPYWDDWSPNQGGTVVYGTFEDPLRFMAQWTDVPHFSGSGTATFQAILFADTNCIVYRYGDPLDLNSPTVGVENQDGTDGVEYSYNQKKVFNGDAIEFYPPNMVKMPE